MFKRRSLLAGVVLAAIAFCSATPASATLSINAGDVVVFAGDSTSNTGANFYAWYDTVGSSAGLFVANVNALFTTPTAKRPSLASGTVSTATGTVATVAAVGPGSIVVVNAGVNGDTIGAGGLQSTVASRITVNSPTVVFIAEGTNDVAAGTDPNTFATAYQSVVDQIHAWNAATKIGCLSIYSRGELWNTGPVWNNGAVDAQIDALNTKIAAVTNCTYINTRAPLLTWEVTNNAGKEATGHATVDGIHLLPAGKVQIGATVLSSITVNPRAAYRRTAAPWRSLPARARRVPLASRRYAGPSAVRVSAARSVKNDAGTTWWRAPASLIHTSQR